MTDLPPPPGNHPLGPPAGPGSYPPPAAPPGYPPPPGPGGYPPPGPGPGPGAYPPPAPAAYPSFGGYQQQGYGWSQGPAVAQYAGFWSRFAAAIVDGLIFSVPTNIVVTAAEPGSGLAALVQLVSFFAQIAYYTVLEGGPEGQTLGKKALGIRVVDAESGRPGIGYPRALGRYFARILSAIPCFLGFFWMLWDPRKQTWHDKLARTIVVKV